MPGARPESKSPEAGAGMNRPYFINTSERPIPDTIGSFFHHKRKAPARELFTRWSGAPNDSDGAGYFAFASQ